MNRDERAKLLKDRKELLRKESFWCKDTWRDFEVYRVPVDALLLNADNRRFAAEKRLMEEKVGHALDPENNPADEQSIISILLDAGLDVDGDVVKVGPLRVTVYLFPWHSPTTASFAFDGLVVAGLGAGLGALLSHRAGSSTDP